MEEKQNQEQEMERKLRCHYIQGRETGEGGECCCVEARDRLPAEITGEGKKEQT